jgi:hypothetical protein
MACPTPSLDDTEHAMKYRCMSLDKERLTGLAASGLLGVSGPCGHAQRWKLRFTLHQPVRALEGTAGDAKLLDHLLSILP